METLAKIFSVPEITNMPPTRRVHSFSANGSGMKLLKPIPFETSRFPNGEPPPLLFKLENFRTRFSPGLASERNRITCCIFVDRIERLESRVIKRISLPFPSDSISSNIRDSVQSSNFGQNFEISLFRGFIEGSSSLRLEGSRRAFFAGFSVALLRQNV